MHDIKELQVIIEKQNYKIKKLEKEIVDLKKKLKLSNKVVRRVKRDEDVLKEKGMEEAIKEMTQKQKAVYLKLLEWRARKAKELNRKQYMVLASYALVELAIIQPQTRDELLLIKGIRYRKIDSFGDEILGVLKKKKQRKAIKSTLYNRVGELWSIEEEENLMKEFESGVPLKLIAEMHHRKIGGIRRRVEKLGLH